MLPSSIRNYMQGKWNYISVYYGRRVSVCYCLHVVSVSMFRMTPIQVMHDHMSLTEISRVNDISFRFICHTSVARNRMSVISLGRSFRLYFSAVTCFLHDNFFKAKPYPRRCYYFINKQILKF